MHYMVALDCSNDIWFHKILVLFALTLKVSSGSKILPDEDHLSMYPNCGLGGSKGGFKAKVRKSCHERN